MENFFRVLLLSWVGIFAGAIFHGTWHIMHDEYGEAAIQLPYLILSPFFIWDAAKKANGGA